MLKYGKTFPLKEKTLRGGENAQFFCLENLRIVVRFSQLALDGSME